jgi:hypothetical protein
MLRNSPYESGFDRFQVTKLACRSSQPIGTPWRLVTALLMTCDALREGLAAHRQYERLTARGMPHDAALRESLGIGPRPSQVTREAAKPLFFSGKA